MAEKSLHSGIEPEQETDTPNCQGHIQTQPINRGPGKCIQPTADNRHGHCLPVVKPGSRCSEENEGTSENWPHWLNDHMSAIQQRCNGQKNLGKTNKLTDRRVDEIKQLLHDSYPLCESVT